MIKNQTTLLTSHFTAVHFFTYPVTHGAGLIIHFNWIYHF